MFWKRESSDEAKVKIIAYTIILFVSSLFVPFVIVSSIQSSFYYKREYWFFETPASAYLAFMAGMICLASALTIYIYAKWKWEERKQGWLLIVGLILCGAGAAGGVDNYYYSNEKGVFLNQLGGIGVKEYNWNDMGSVKIVYRVHNGSVRLDSYQFKTKEGEKITLPYTKKFSDNKWKVDEVISQKNLPVKDNFDNPIVD